MRGNPVKKDDAVLNHLLFSTHASLLLAGSGAVIVWLYLAIPIFTSGAPKNSTPASMPVAGGEQSFVSHCSGCHGLDGRGGEHAPNIATRPTVQNLSEAELERIVQNGIPSQGMPSFNALGAEGIKNVVDYLLVLQGKQAAVAVNGSPSHGKGLFFGGAGCSSCHMIQGKGGFLGADLTRYSRTHSPQEIRQAIVDPNKNLSPQAETVVAVTRDGRKLTGIARNEDNFSLQLQTLDGAFHLLMKSDLRKVSHQPVSLMPSGYGSMLTPGDIDDLISFLVKVGGVAEDVQESAGGSTP